MSNADETDILAPGASAVLDDDKFIQVVDFPSKFHPEIPVFHSIPKMSSITFLILYRQQSTRKRWMVPNFETAADFNNDTICSMFNVDAPFAETYDRVGRWGLFSTLVLHGQNQPLVEEFRSTLSRWSYKGMDFDTFPRDDDAGTKRSNSDLEVLEIILIVVENTNFACNQVIMQNSD